MTLKTKITINEIAKLAGTSKTTVSFYLNGKFDRMSEATRAIIEQVIADTGYTPNVAARSLNSVSMKLIGVIIGDITNTFANQLVKGIDEVAKEQNYQLIVGNSNYDFEQEKNYVDKMLAMGVDGFIIQPTTNFNNLIDKIKLHGKEIVFIDSQIDVSSNAWVKTNNYEAVLETTNMMVDYGYDDFIMLTADPTVLSTRQERTTGFIDALNLRNKKYETVIVDNDVTSDEITEIINKSLNLSERTLVFVMNCWLLPIVYMGMQGIKNLMPSTVGLIGFDNTEWSVFSSPTVTTIVQPSHEEGRQSAKILIDRIEKSNIEPPQQILKCSVNLMHSTSKI